MGSDTSGETTNAVETLIRDLENWKGFYGSTKFYYGPGENDYYQGPPKENEKNPNENIYEFFR